MLELGLTAVELEIAERIAEIAKDGDGGATM